MMPNLTIAATAATPEINFLFDRHWLSLRGESYPENAQAFYGPILEAVQHYLAQLTATPITVEVQLAYFNSSSTKILLELFDSFNQASLNGNQVTLNWHYDPDDDTILEFGQEIAEDCPALDLNTLALVLE